ncbi:SDR family oxidoreductase [Kribbella turkmenica]|uniref:SDR family oxidoreductase n=1 Tax=Kribbella turkmenica TaxID=2530375 RepID=A0A4R4XEU6_9ACTN|nr:SDR family oxidoreductase [Kribbella turkmenica]TDD29225.1 SDR family oxidoreductase [Kribbella turkmenica]
MDLGLQGRNILVTGATGLIGSAIVQALASEGAVPLVHYWTGVRRARDIAEATGGIALRADLRSEAEVESLFDAAITHSGSIDGLVANAGWWPGAPVPSRDLPLYRWRTTLEQNLTITFLTARAYLQHVRDIGRGSLVLVSSAAADLGEDGFADYAAAKSAIAFGLTRTLAREIVADAPTARVNAVAPSWVPPPGPVDQGRLRQALATSPLDRPATPTEVANTILWLLSDEASSYVTGQVIRVTGGLAGKPHTPAP